MKMPPLMGLIWPVLAENRPKFTHYPKNRLFLSGECELTCAKSQMFPSWLRGNNLRSIVNLAGLCMTTRSPQIQTRYFLFCVKVRPTPTSTSNFCCTILKKSKTQAAISGLLSRIGQGKTLQVECRQTTELLAFIRCRSKIWNLTSLCTWTGIYWCPELSRQALHPTLVAHLNSVWPLKNQSNLQLTLSATLSLIGPILYLLPVM